MIKITGFFFILLINIALMLVLTMIIASLTLIERRILALIQRRVGPQFVGYKGRLQYIADALKLFTKGALIPDEANKFWFITIPSIVAALCYSLWMNSVWGPSISLFEIEYNLVYASLFSILFSFCVILTGYFSKNKYAMLGAVRCCLTTLNLELFVGLMILNITLLTSSFSFLPAVILQEIIWFIFVFLGVSGLIIIIFLLETGRAPFDLAEAESELVAGYTVEYGGFFFGLYYLGEYLHLFFFSSIISILFLGGWEFPNFLFFFFSYTYVTPINIGFDLQDINFNYFAFLDDLITFFLTSYHSFKFLTFWSPIINDIFIFYFNYLNDLLVELFFLDPSHKSELMDFYASSTAFKIIKSKFIEFFFFKIDDYFISIVKLVN